MTTTRRKNHQVEWMNPSLLITHWVGHEAGGRRSCIWPPEQGQKPLSVVVTAGH
jgi:hypothetical protein